MTAGGPDGADGLATDGDEAPSAADGGKPGGPDAAEQDDAVDNGDQVADPAAGNAAREEQRRVGRAFTPIAADVPPERRALAEALRDLVSSSGLNLEAIGRRLGVHAATISRSLDGSTVLTKERFEGIVNACGGDIERLRPLWEATTAPSPPAPPIPKPKPGNGEQQALVPRRAWWRRPIYKIGAAVLAIVALLVVVGLAIAMDEQPNDSVRANPRAVWNAPRSCSTTSIVVTSNGVDECVGKISALSTMPMALQPALNAISVENAAVPADAKVVDLGYLIPVPAVAPDPGDNNAVDEQLVHYDEELTGLVRVMQRANGTSTVGDVPKIRVTVYNVGDDSTSWVRVVSDIKREADAGRLAAVAGLGPGVGGTGPLIEALARLSIPVFTSQAIADKLTELPSDPRALFRSTATSTQLAAAAATTLRERASVQLVQDVWAENVDDRDLGADFTKALPGVARDGARMASTPINYDSSLGPAGSTFSTALTESCPLTATGSSSGPNAYFVAGRGPQLAQFLISLTASPCPGGSMVLAGPEGAYVLEQLRQARANPRSPEDTQLVNAFNSGRFQFRFVGLAHPDLWALPTFARNYTATIASFNGLVDAPELETGAQLAGYSAGLTAIACIRAAATQYAPVPRAATVLNACAKTYTATRPLYNAAGPVAFDVAGQGTTGPVPIVEVRANGAAPAVPGSR